MFCWGNTVNGELGLGGIEENHILSPAEITNFESINNIKNGKPFILINMTFDHIFYFSYIHV